MKMQRISSKNTWGQAASWQASLRT